MKAKTYFYWVKNETNLNWIPSTLSFCVALGLMEIGKNEELIFNSHLNKGAGHDWVVFHKQ